MTTLFIVLAAAVAGMIAAGIICYERFAVPAMLPLAEQDLELCRRVVARGRAIPWVCRHALKTGLCPCQPCERLEQERAQEAEGFARERERAVEQEVEARR
jgi:hypothetical protein